MFAHGVIIRHTVGQALKFTLIGKTYVRLYLKMSRWKIRGYDIMIPMQHVYIVTKDVQATII